jgi:hypothetical protein
VSTGRIYISRDVVFDENIFPFASLHPNAGARLRAEILLLPSNTSSISSNEGAHINDNVSIVPITNPLQVTVEDAPATSQNAGHNATEITYSGTHSAEDTTANDYSMMSTASQAVSSENMHGTTSHTGRSSRDPVQDSVETPLADRSAEPVSPPRSPRMHAPASPGDIDTRSARSPEVSTPAPSSSNDAGSSASPDTLTSGSSAALIPAPPPPPEPRTRRQKGIQGERAARKVFDIQKFIKMAPCDMACLHLQENQLLSMRLLLISVGRRLWKKNMTLL